MLIVLVFGESDLARPSDSCFWCEEVLHHAGLELGEGATEIRRGEAQQREPGRGVVLTPLMPWLERTLPGKRAPRQHDMREVSAELAGLSFWGIDAVDVGRQQREARGVDDEVELGREGRLVRRYARRFVRRFELGRSLDGLETIAPSRERRFAPLVKPDLAWIERGCAHAASRWPNDQLRGSARKHFICRSAATSRLTVL